jgi:dihydropteroate synthase
LAAVATTYLQGAKAFRVHDVAQTKQFLDMLIAIEDAQ